ncbi:toll-like receptor 3, partial [Austrofundulus limnaeus]|uniref:Toll-like receptor 3 n=1 Tax=Austrofundulus limnaeus TaxID=52670 RepID=A0A2I4CPR0_AUSLI
MKHWDKFEAVNIYINAPEVDTFRSNPELKSLTLTHNDLSDLQPELFLPIPNLEKLDLSKSELKSLDFLVQANLTALRYLKLTNNEITVINEEVLSSLPSLTYLDMSINTFTCDCSNADFIQWIKNNNQTQVVNAHRYKCFFPMNKRGTLLLDFDIKPCSNDGSFLHFLSSSSLVFLTLLTSFIYHFLRWQLAYTFHLFLAIPKLEILDLSESKLKSLDFLVQANLSALRYLKVTDNGINVVNETVFNSLPSLTYLDLSNNPFTCECSNADFIFWTKGNIQTQV